ncbi:MAG: GGDEF domain-containing protein [Candidatus Colwellbacteria bacterium]
MDKDKQIEELKAEIEKLKTLTNKDELTGILNRRGFKEEVRQFIGEVSDFKDHPERRKSLVIKDFSLVIFDIDDFKKLNDTHGHQVGDRALQFLAKLILERAREIDLVARWGGEELIVGLPGANVEDAYNFAEDVRQRLSGLAKAQPLREHKLENSEIETKFTVSGGVAGFHEAEDFEELFKNADAALYEAKNSGKNKIIKFVK